MSRRESIRGTIGVRHQSSSGPPTVEMVTVAVLPPRLPEGVAPPTGLGASDAFSWDEAINWSHNKKIVDQEEKVSSTRKFMRRAGLTTQRQKVNPDLPPFIFRKVTYDVWRKHYAKDKDGKYKGTLAPAEDCLLLPEDVERWRAGEPETMADLWTRGKAALPVYDQVQDESILPPYSEHYVEPTVEDMRLNSVVSNTSIEEEPARAEAVPSSASASANPPPSGWTADGKTSEQIIAEAKERAEAKKLEQKRKGWKDSIKRGTQVGLLGANFG